MDGSNVDFYLEGTVLKSSWLEHGCIRNILTMKDFRFDQKSYSLHKSVYDLDTDKYCIYLK